MPGKTTSLHINMFTNKYKYILMQCGLQTTSSLYRSDLTGCWKRPPAAPAQSTVQVEAEVDLKQAEWISFSFCTFQLYSSHLPYLIVMHREPDLSISTSLCFCPWNINVPPPPRSAACCVSAQCPSGRPIHLTGMVGEASAHAPPWHCIALETGPGAPVHKVI